MDVKVSRRERRWQNDGPVDVLVDNICDFYPVFADDARFDGEDIYIGQDKISEIKDKENIIMDVEILNDDRDELLDRAMFAVMKQRGADPVEPRDGIQWAEAFMGEVLPPLIVQQVHSSVFEEGAGVRVMPDVIKNGRKESLVFKIELTNAL